MTRLNIQTIIAGLVLAAAVLARVADPTPVARLRQSIFDTYQRLAPRPADPARPVVVVDVDEDSLARLGQWPWPRTRLVEIVEGLKAAGARTVALDLVLAEPDRLSPSEIARHLKAVPEMGPVVAALPSLPDNDARLAEALATFPVVLGVSGELAPGVRQLAKPKAGLASAGDDPRLFAPTFPGGIGSLDVLAAAARGIGAVNWLPAHDQIVRQVPLVVTVAGTLYPSLSLEQLRLAQEETTLFVRASGGSGIEAFGQKTGIDSVRVGNRDLATDADGQLWLRFAHYDPGRYVSAYRVIDGSAGADMLAGRHVVVGSSATGLLDLRATPLEASVPGVEIHAQALEQMLSGDYLVRPAYATGIEIAFLVALGLLLSWLIQRYGPVTAAATGAGAIAVVGLASWLAYTRAGYLFDPVYPALATLALYLTGSLYNYIRAETERARVRQAFGHYVSAPLVEELARDPGRLKLGGENREITLLFADVRGFSRLSEGMEAEEVIRFVNALFTPLADIILDNRGTIDKFMGDAVMAFWNAPVDDPKHALNAARAALAMIGRLHDMNVEWARLARARGETHRPVRIGIGLNTGTCCVGNVGSPQRFDYSILGDVVNVASRLEEATKTFGLPIVAGERTVAGCPHLAFLELDSIALRGKDRPERVFALLGDEEVAASPRFQDLKRLRADLVAARAAGQSSRAAAVLERCRALDWPEIEPLLDYDARHAAAG